MDSKYIKMTLVSLGLILLISVIAVPFLCANGKIVNLDGTPGYIDNPDLWASIDPFSAVIYTIGDFICHQQMDRTFILNGNEMPICVRDLGILIGMIIGSALMLFLRSYSRKKMIIISVTGLLLMLIDWLIQHLFSLNIPATRLITGILAGTSALILISMLLDGTLTDKI